MKNINSKVLAALVLAVFVLPVAVSAQSMTTAQLQAEIQQLEAQLQVLQQQLALTQGGSAAWCYTFNTNLSIGMTGLGVTALQTALQKDGESVMANGTFDDQTAAAVTGFQQKYASVVLTPNGLSNGTGYAGKATRAKLNSLFGCNGNNPIVPTPTSSSISIYPSAGPVGTVITLSSPFNVCGGTTAVVDCSPNRFNEYVFLQNGSVVGQGLPGIGNSASGGPEVQVPSSFAPGVYTLAAQNCLGKSCTTYPLAPFTITAATTPSAGISVISPNGGETLTQGQPFTIKWNPNGDPASYVGLNLANQSGVPILGIGNVPNTGSYVWNVPSTYSGNNFTMMVAGNSIATSAATFSIIPLTSGSTSNNALSISPTSGPAGTTIALTGSFSVCSGGVNPLDCSPNRFNQYVLLQNGVAVGGGLSSVGYAADGRSEVQIPASIAPGVYQFAVQNCLGISCTNYPQATFTVTGGTTLSVSANSAFPSGGVVTGSASVKIGSYVLSNPSSEAVIVQSVTIQGGPSASLFQNFKVMVNGVQFGNGYSVIANNTGAGISGSSLVILPKSSIAMDVYADVLTSDQPGSTNATGFMGCVAAGQSSNSAYSCNQAGGQTMAVATLVSGGHL